MTPETYSGVAVEAMAKVESDRSARLPSRMPASTPTRRAAGTITAKAQNMSLPVKASRLPTMAPTSSFDTVE